MSEERQQQLEQGCKEIPKEWILNGLKSGIIQIINNENDHEIAAQIGDFWFYFTNVDANLEATKFLKDHEINVIADMIHDVINDEPIRALDSDDLNGEWEYYRAVLWESRTIQFELHLAEMGYVKTDDYQFQKKIGDGVYRMADVMEMPDGNYRVFGDTVDLREFSKEHTEAIILAYYDSINELCEAYPDEEVRKGIIAECIFETQSWQNPEFSKDNVIEENILEVICRNVDSCEEVSMSMDAGIYETQKELAMVMEEKDSLSNRIQDAKNVKQEKQNDAGKVADWGNLER